MILHLTQRELFVLALAARYAESNVDDIVEAYTDELAEGREGEGVIILTDNDGNYNVAGTHPEWGEYSRLASKLIREANK